MHCRKISVRSQWLMCDSHSCAFILSSDDSCVLSSWLTVERIRQVMFLTGNVHSWGNLMNIIISLSSCVRSGASDSVGFSSQRKGVLSCSVADVRVRNAHCVLVKSLCSSL